MEKGRIEDREKGKRKERLKSKQEEKDHANNHNLTPSSITENNISNSNGIESELYYREIKQKKYHKLS